MLKMLKNICSPVILMIILFSHQSVSASTWLVGPNKTYKKPSEVATRVSNYDTVLIDAGEYLKDVCTWRAHHLLLKGVGGRAHLNAQFIAQSGKAIWVITGDSAIIENIEFSNCKVPDKNGAGIRLEGTHLVVRSCYFHDNEDGILAGDNANSNVLIEYSEFKANGYGDGFSHNMYFNHIRSFTFRYNYSHQAKVGHELKSRAHLNIILYNRFSNEDGNASYEIDLSNGGRALIMGNIIQQGARSDNGGIISFGKEGLNNPGPHQLFVIHNTIISQRGAGIAIQLQDGTDSLVIINNIIGGNLTLINGIPKKQVSQNNLVNKDLMTFNFVDINSLDLGLTPLSTAINYGISLSGNIFTFPASPDKEYVHPAMEKEKKYFLQPDVGAFEYEVMVSNEDQKKRAPFSVHTIVNNSIEIVIHDESDKLLQYSVLDVLGRIYVLGKRNTSFHIPLHQLPNGIYVLSIQYGDFQYNKRMQI